MKSQNISDCCIRWWQGLSLLLQRSRQLVLPLLLLGFWLTGFLFLFLCHPTIQKADLVNCKGTLAVNIEAMKKVSRLTYEIVDATSTAKLLLGHLLGIVLIEHLKRRHQAPEFFGGPRLEFQKHVGRCLV